MLLPVVSGQEGGELEGVVRVEEQPVKPIVDVKLGQVDPALRWVGVAQEPEQAWQRAPKLHHLLRQLGDAVAIDAEPGVVDDHPGPAVELVLDSHRGESEVGVGQGTVVGSTGARPRSRRQ
ncbi:MAG: hypothetical protein MZV63_16840 [Marinilabiliales bacterium]|nr:hypothetical protein [Marinilabiliales bacterium]